MRRSPPPTHPGPLAKQRSRGDRAAPVLLVLLLRAGAARSEPPELRLDVSVDLQRRVHARLVAVRDTGASLLLGAECADLDGFEPTPFRLLRDGRPERFPVQGTDLAKGRLRLRSKCKHGAPRAQSLGAGAFEEVLTAPLGLGGHRVRVLYGVQRGQRCGEVAMWGDSSTRIRCWSGELASAELEVQPADLLLELRVPPSARVDRPLPVQVIFRNRSAAAISIGAGSLQVVDDRAAGAEEVDYEICPLEPLRLAPGQGETVRCPLAFAEGHDNAGVHRLRARYIDGSEPPRRWAESAPTTVRLTGSR